MRTLQRRVAITIGLVALLAANYFLRANLEEAPRYLYSFLERFYADKLPILFGQLPTWRLFVPMPELTGAWAASTLILVYVLERVLTPAGVWYLVNALTILVAFGTTYPLFRSAIFSFTFAICMGFGTQFYHAYAVTGGIASYLVASYNMLLLFATVQIIRGVSPRWAWYLAFAFSLFLNIVGYEGWLDVLVLVWVSAPFVYLGLRRMDRTADASRAARMTAILTVAGGLYVFVKVTWGYGQVQGSESDVIFNYDKLLLMSEDLISNIFTHTYLSLSNFLPPILVGGSSLYWFGADHLVGAQHGYHSGYEYLVPMHQVFFWRYYAGAGFVLIVVALWHAVMRGWRRPSAWTLALIVFLLMILVPGSTHTMIKFRPMNAMPALTYHVTVGILGVSLLLSWLLTSACSRIRRRPLVIALVIAAWGVLFYDALARPPYLAYMAAQSGLGESLYPNPMRALVTRLGGTYTPPLGMAAYRLTPFRGATGNTRAALGDLPAPLPPPSEWVPSDYEWVTTIAGGVEVNGDATRSGYQIMSPPVGVRPNTRYIVRVKFDLLAGDVCGGILSGDQATWLVAPIAGNAEYAFDSGARDGIRVVLANCNAAEDGNPRSHFKLFGGSFGIISAP
jgi:hypothetical protein